MKMGTHRRIPSGGAAAASYNNEFLPTIDTGCSTDGLIMNPTEGYSMTHSNSPASTTIFISGSPIAIPSLSPTDTVDLPRTSSITPCSTHQEVQIEPLGGKRTSLLTQDNLHIKSQYVRRYLKYNPLLNCLLPLSCIVALVVLVFLLKDFPKHALQWIERQEADSWSMVLWFLVFFVIVSFPVTVGYLVLIITSGYLFGFFKGLLVVVVGANFGVAVAHYVIKSFQSKLPVHK